MLGATLVTKKTTTDGTWPATKAVSGDGKTTAFVSDLAQRIAKVHSKRTGRPWEEYWGQVYLLVAKLYPRFQGSQEEFVPYAFRYCLLELLERPGPDSLTHDVEQPSRKGPINWDKIETLPWQMSHVMLSRLRQKPLRYRLDSSAILKQVRQRYVMEDFLNANQP